MNKNFDLAASGKDCRKVTSPNSVKVMKNLYTDCQFTEIFDSPKLDYFASL